jgi:hypothetical protein
MVDLKNYKITCLFEELGNCKKLCESESLEKRETFYSF